MKTLRIVPNSKTYFRFVMLLVVVSLSAALTPRTNATAPQLSISVVNNSQWAIRHLYLSPADNDNWGTDQLNESSINSGATRTLNVSWDQSSAKLVAEDQDGCFMYTTVEATGNPVWTIANNATRNCGD
jgi:hypothetical protein